MVRLPSLSLNLWLEIGHRIGLPGLFHLNRGGFHQDFKLISTGFPQDFHQKNGFGFHSEANNGRGVRSSFSSIVVVVSF